MPSTLRATPRRIQSVRLACLLAGLLAVAALAPARARAGDGAAPCPRGTRPHPSADACVPVQDARTAAPGRAARDLPSLARQRRDRRFREGLAPIEAPVPGGIGSGTLYASGALAVAESAELELSVLVHPAGVEPSTANLDWLFSTATNRTQAGVEVVAGYQGANPGWLGVFDWSCSAADPCQGGEVGPAWIWTFPLATRPEYLFAVYDDGGHLHQAVRYVNRSERIGEGPTPRWRNDVLLWNVEFEVWDLVYSHAYDGEQPDCSVTGCAWWGPILEEFRVDPAAPLPEIRELGFHDTTLRLDGVAHALSPAETDFVAPLAPWQLFHLDANGAWGAGNVLGAAAACADGIDNDGNGLVDWAGGDPGCTGPSDETEAPPAASGPSCGIGPELVLGLPLLLGMRVCRRREELDRSAPRA